MYLLGIWVVCLMMLLFMVLRNFCSLIRNVLVWVFLVFDGLGNGCMSFKGKWFRKSFLVKDGLF